MQVAADCALLEELKVMDYSLLLGVHYRSGGYRSTPLATDKVLNASCCSLCNRALPVFTFISAIVLRCTGT